MMMRVYRCTVVAGKEAAFREFASKKGHPWLRSKAGLIAFFAGRPMGENHSRHRCMVQIWESLAAIQAAIGDNWDQPLTLSEEVRELIDWASVEHYEVADLFRTESDVDWTLAPEVALRQEN